MNNYFYSATTNVFYPVIDKDVYISNGNWPADALEVSDDTYNEFVSLAPDGKERSPDSYGLPSWVDAAPATPEEVLAGANGMKVQLMNEATGVISVLQDAVDLDIATDEESSSLTN
ncbi:MAG: tail fiber assembly protein [Erwinia billingiae]